MKSTPGPWKLRKCLCGKEACKLYQLDNVGMFYNGSGFSKEDAHLVAAAPDMYEWMKQYCDNCYQENEANVSNFMEECRQCRCKELLAKAEGGGKEDARD